MLRWRGTTRNTGGSRNLRTVTASPLRLCWGCNSACPWRVRACAAGWKFWVPAASLNFYAVPLQYQVC